MSRRRTFPADQPVPTNWPVIRWILAGAVALELWTYLPAIAHHL